MSGVAKTPFMGPNIALMQVYGSAKLRIYLSVVGSVGGFFKLEDGSIADNSAMLTKELHLTAGQAVDIYVADATQVYTSYNGAIGFETWFCGHLIIPD